MIELQLFRIIPAPARLKFEFQDVLVGFEIDDLAVKNCKFLVVEMSNGQLVEDVRLVVQGKTTVDLYNRMGGVVPTTDEVIEHIQNRYCV